MVRVRVRVRVRFRVRVRVRVRIRVRVWLVGEATTIQRRREQWYAVGSPTTTVYIREDEG